MPFEEKAKLLDTADIRERLLVLVPMLCRQLEILEMRAGIQARVKEQLALDWKELEERPSYEATRIMVLKLQRRFLVEEIRAARVEGEDKGEKPPPLRSATVHRIDVTLPAVVAQPSTWSAVLRYLGIERPPSVRTSIDDQLVTIRKSQRREVLLQQVKAIDDELEKK